MMKANTTSNNLFSQKVGINAVKKLSVFDQIIFGRPDDKIKSMLFSSYPRDFKVAIYFRRTLQVYD